jgi:hypothetical protein
MPASGTDTLVAVTPVSRLFKLVKKLDSYSGSDKSKSPLNSLFENPFNVTSVYPIEAKKFATS